MSKLITVASFTSPIEAYLAKGRLETEGVQTFLAHENHIWANWMYSHALGGVKIQVLAQDKELAEQILEKHNKGDYEADLESEYEDFKQNCCPKCGAKEFSSRVPLLSILFLVLSLGLIGFIYPPRKEKHKCSRCGYNWKH